MFLITYANVCLSVKIFFLKATVVMYNIEVYCTKTQWGQQHGGIPCTHFPHQNILAYTWIGSPKQPTSLISEGKPTQNVLAITL